MATAPRLTVRDRRALRSAIVDSLDRLDDQIASLTRSFADIVDSAALGNTDDEHDPEGSTIAFERAQVSALLAQATADRVTTRDALTRLADDEYGVCTECRGFIGVERLLALPAATRCIRCASR
jgi:DnaK suppressor protein